MHPAQKSWITGVFGLLLAAAPSGAHTRFESPPVRPIALTPDGSRLVACATDDHRVVVYDVTAPGAPVALARIPVGLEPVTVRARTDDEVWVVNHVSDTISLVRLDQKSVVRTLQVGDEPTDVVFAGTPERAFVCVSGEDMIQVFDPASPTTPPIEIPLGISRPRALAVSPDGATLYVVANDSGNRTTVVPFAIVGEEGGLPPPNPPMDPGLPAAPLTGLIVKHDGTHWKDETGASWDAVLPYALTDHDLVKIHTTTLAVTGVVTGIGTTLFNVCVDPSTGLLAVTNQEATNEIRFEPNLAAQFLRNRVTIVNPSNGDATPRHLNEHVNYANPAGNPAERALSLSIPVDIVAASSGGAKYVAAFGSAKVGVLDANGAVVRRIQVGAGPAGLALDEAGDRLFVLNSTAHTISEVDLGDDSSVQVSLGFDPVPATIREGRELFYDGENSSAHGDVSCAGCHVFGGLDDLAWDLGNPIGEFMPAPPPVEGDSLMGFHPMKGPMTTQTLKSIDASQPFHWRGDRPQLVDFDPAFVSLLGRASQLSPSDFQKMESFILSMEFAANPFRKLDGGLPAMIDGGNPTVGETFFNTPVPDGGGGCFGCHALPSGGGDRVVMQARVQALSSQDMAVPNLLGLNKKRRFGKTGAVVRGFGTTHEGSNEFVFPHQLQLGGGDSNIPGGDLPHPLALDRKDVEAFLLAFDTGVHPVVGAQWTMDGTNTAQGMTRLTTMSTAASLGEAGLIAKGRDITGAQRGWVYAGGAWLPDRAAEAPISLAALVASASAGTEITFTGVLPGEETRLGIDHDGDGYRDRDEIDHGSDPDDPGSVPNGVAVLEGGSSTLVSAIRLRGANPARTTSRFAIDLSQGERIAVRAYDVTGRMVRTFVDGKPAPAGRTEYAWDLRNDSGRALADGVYFVRLEGTRSRAVERVVILR